MKIFDYYATANPEFECPKIWRCIAPNAEAEEMSAFGRNPAEKMAIERTINQINNKRGSIRSRIKWQAKNSKTRYSDGKIPVVYFAKDHQTAIVECFHWAYQRIGMPKGEYIVRLIVFSVRFSGNLKDISVFTPPCNDLVHDSDYQCCNDIAVRACKEKKIDGLYVRSARRESGRNVPLFKEDNVGDVLEDDLCFVQVSNATKICSVGGNDFQLVNEDVFATVSTAN